MSSELPVIPLFPLPMVVFPGETIALHIFEPRYKEMIAECRRREAMGRGGLFAIVPLLEQGPGQVACTVRIASIIKEYEDGQLDLMATGQRRCRLVETYRVEQYDTGRVQDLVDEESALDTTLATRAFGLHRELIETLVGETPEEAAYSGHTNLSFFLAPSAGMNYAQKLDLLGLNEENQRLSRIVSHLEDFAPAVEKTLPGIRSAVAGWRIQSMDAE